MCEGSSGAARGALRSLAALPAFFLLLLAGGGHAFAQCTLTGPLTQFEPNPPGPAAPRNVVLLSGVSFNRLSLYQGGAGGPWRIFMQETFGYSVLDLSNPAQPSVLRYDYLPFAVNPVSRNGDGQSYTQTMAASPDGQRVAIGVTSGGPANPPWMTVVGWPDGYGFLMGGDTAPAGANGTAVLKSGARYVVYGLAANDLFVADVTARPASWAPGNVAYERTSFPGGSSLAVAGNYLVYRTSTGDVQVIDGANPGAIGNVATALPRITVSAASGIFGGHGLGAVQAAVDPGNAKMLWILVELSPTGTENSPSYALFSLTQDAGGTFGAPVSAGPNFRVPSAAGENWTASGSSSALVENNGTLFVLMWAFRRSPSFQYVLYTTAPSGWGTQSATTITTPGFSLGEMKALSSGTSVYGYMASQNAAWVLPMACEDPHAKASAFLSATNAGTGAPVVSGDAVVYGETIAFTPQVLPTPKSGQTSDLAGFRWNIDFDFHAGAPAEDNGALLAPRLREPDNDQFPASAYPPAAGTLVGPCDPRSGGVPATGAGCWTSVRTNASAGGPDFTGAEPAGSLKPLVLAFEANNTNGSSGPRLFTINWKRPTPGLASTQILGGDALTATSDGHPASSGWKWYFDGALAACTGTSCTPAGAAATAGAHAWFISAPYPQIGYATPDYAGVPMGTYTVAYFVPLFTVNGTATGPVSTTTAGTISVVNSSKRATGFTGAYSYCLVPAAQSCTSYTAWGMADPSSTTGVPPSSATIPNPGVGSWKLKIRVRDSGGGTTDWPDANPATGVAITVVATVSASASVSPSPAISGDTVTFSCSATGGTGSFNYRWDGQFGTVGNAQTFSTKVTNPGPSNILVSLDCTATDAGSGAFASSTATVTVQPPPKPTATATAAPGVGNNGASVTFSCAASGGTGSGYTYAWTAGGGSPFNTSPSFTQVLMNTAGADQTVAYTCTVRDSAGSTGSSVASVLIHPYPPAITVSASANPVSYGVPVQMTCAAAGGTGAYSYNWSFTDGTVASGAVVSHTFGSVGAYTATCTVLDSGTGSNAQAAIAMNVTLPAGAGGPYALATLTPCRVVDTRSTHAPSIPPAGFPDRTFPVTSVCGIPADAKAVSVNVTVTNVAASGFASLYRGDGAPGAASTASLVPGRTRANNALVQLALDGSGTIKVHNASPGAFDLIVDVSGYFR